jgi:hypothetical protein
VILSHLGKPRCRESTQHQIFFVVYQYELAKHLDLANSKGYCLCCGRSSKSFAWPLGEQAGKAALLFFH